MKRLPNHKGSISNSLCVFTVHNIDNFLKKPPVTITKVATQH